MTISFSFLPIDRLHALARGHELSDRVVGAALLADVSGFTTLADALASALGGQRGAEELSRHLNRVYAALLGPVGEYGGTVIGFSGDAMTCWFDAGDAEKAGTGELAEAARRAATCALAMQRAMSRVARIEVPGSDAVTIAAKVAIATGPARRFQVGDPAIQYLDALAGATLDRLAATERVAGRGEVMVDAETARALEGYLLMGETRRLPDAAGAGTAVVLHRMKHLAEPAPWPALAIDSVADEGVRPWLLATVHARLRAGESVTAGDTGEPGLDALAELRPAVAMFVRFEGIDYDDDRAAGAKLDAFVTWTQRVLARYEGTLIDLTIGDKGSYLYAAFGAPVAHEDDADRALRAALEVRAAPSALTFLRGVEIGISGGRTRAGAVGGPSRRAYTVTGNDVNVAARLMQKASRGEVLVARHVVDATRGGFVTRPFGTLPLKGKSEPVDIVALDRAQEAGTMRPPRRAHLTSAMIGREQDLAIVVEKIERAARGSGQLVAIRAEAGIGKSRLLAAVLEAARKRGFEVYAGEAQSFGTTATYLAWHGVWRSLLRYDGTVSADRREAALASALAKIDPALLPRLPLLGAAVGVPIADNDLTKQFEAKLRKDSLEALLTTCLRARAAERPVVIALEDVHWMDPVSIDLLESIGRAVAGMPVLLVATSRIEEGAGKATGRLAPLPHFTDVRLHELGRGDSAGVIAQLVRARLGSEAPVPDRFVALVHARAEGNPFLAEELVEDLFDRGITPERALTDEALELPTNVASAILSRMDRLPMAQQTLLKVASVIGRLYFVAWLWGVYPELGTPAHVRDELDSLERRDLVASGDAAPNGDGEDAYSFKHSLIQEVIYESLPFETRAKLHGALAKWLEERGEGSVDLLAFHYGRTENVEKQREYFRKAGDAAAARYANEAAAGYYEKLVEVEEDGGKAEALLSLGMAKAAVSKWGEAEIVYRRAIELIEGRPPSNLRGHLAAALAATHVQRARYQEAFRDFETARSEFGRTANRDGEMNVLIEEANLYRLQGKFEDSQRRVHESLRVEGQATDARRIARAYHVLGTTAVDVMKFDDAQRWWGRSLEIMQALGDKPGVAALMVNQALTAWAEKRYGDAQALLEQALPLCEELGMRWHEIRATELLALILVSRDEYAPAFALYRQALATLRDLGALRDIAELLMCLPGTWSERSGSARHDYVLRLGGAGSALFDLLGIPPTPFVQTYCGRGVAAIRAHVGEEIANAAWAEGRAMGAATAIEYGLGVLSELSVVDRA